MKERKEREGSRDGGIGGICFDPLSLSEIWKKIDHKWVIQRKYIKRKHCGSFQLICRQFSFIFVEIVRGGEGQRELHGIKLFIVLFIDVFNQPINPSTRLLILLTIDPWICMENKCLWSTHLCVFCSMIWALYGIKFHLSITNFLLLGLFKFLLQDNSGRSILALQMWDLFLYWPVLDLRIFFGPLTVCIDWFSLLSSIFGERHAPIWSDVANF